jgi:hypothetical protein
MQAFTGLHFWLIYDNVAAIHATLKSGCSTRVSFIGDQPITLNWAFPWCDGQGDVQLTQSQHAAVFAHNFSSFTTPQTITQYSGIDGWELLYIVALWAAICRPVVVPFSPVLELVSGAGSVFI